MSQQHTEMHQHVNNNGKPPIRATFTVVLRKCLANRQSGWYIMKTYSR